MIDYTQRAQQWSDATRDASVRTLDNIGTAVVYLFNTEAGWTICGVVVLLIILANSSSSSPSHYRSATARAEVARRAALARQIAEYKSPAGYRGRVKVDEKPKRTPEPAAMPGRGMMITVAIITALPVVFAIGAAIARLPMRW